MAQRSTKRHWSDQFKMNWVFPAIFFAAAAVVVVVQFETMFSLWKQLVPTIKICKKSMIRFKCPKWSGIRARSYIGINLDGDDSHVCARLVRYSNCMHRSVRVDFTVHTWASEWYSNPSSLSSSNRIKENVRRGNLSMAMRSYTQRDVSRLSLHV